MRGELFFMGIMLWLLFVGLSIWTFEVEGVVEIKLVGSNTHVFVILVLKGQTLIMFESIKIEVVHTK